MLVPTGEYGSFDLTKVKCDPHSPRRVAVHMLRKGDVVDIELNTYLSETNRIERTAYSIEDIFENYGKVWVRIKWIEEENQTLS